MVAPKTIASTNKTSEKTTSKIVEPDGMMTIDLNSNEYNLEEHKQLVKKNKKWEQLKYLSKLLCLMGSICMIIAFFMIVAFLNKEYHFMSSPLININQTSNHSLTNEQYLSQYISNLTKLMLKKRVIEKLSMKDYSKEMTLCRLTKTLDDCCKIFRESSIQVLLDICTVDDILKTFIDYELDSKREKRQVLQYNEVPLADYGNGYFWPLQENQEFADQYVDNFGQENFNYQEQHQEYLQHLDNRKQIGINQETPTNYNQEYSNYQNILDNFENIPNSQTDTAFKKILDQQQKLDLEPVENQDIAFKPYDLQNPEHSSLNQQSNFAQLSDNQNILHNFENVPKLYSGLVENQETVFKPYDVPNPEHASLNQQDPFIQPTLYLPIISDTHVVPYLGHPETHQQQFNHYQTANAITDKHQQPIAYSENNKENNSNLQYQNEVTLSPDMNPENKHLQLNTADVNFLNQQSFLLTSAEPSKLENYRKEPKPHKQAAVPSKINIEPHQESEQYEKTQTLTGNDQIFIKNNKNILQQDPLLQIVHENQFLDKNKVFTQENNALGAPNTNNFLLLPSEVQDHTLNHVTNRPYSNEVGLARNLEFTQIDKILNRQNQVTIRGEHHSLPNSREISNDKNNFDRRTANIIPTENDKQDFNPEQMNLRFPENFLSEEGSHFRKPMITKEQLNRQSDFSNFVPEEAKDNIIQQFNLRNNFIEDDKKLVTLNYGKAPGNLVFETTDSFRNIELKNNTREVFLKDSDVIHQQNLLHTNMSEVLPISSTTNNVPETGKCDSVEYNTENSGANENIGAFHIDEDDLNFSRDPQILNDELSTSDKNTVQNESDIFNDNTKRLEHSQNHFNVNEQKEKHSFRENVQQSENFRPKTKLEAFATASEDIQSTQQTVVSPCFYPYMSSYMPPVRVGSPLDSNYLKVVTGSHPRVQQQPFYVINPPMYYNIPQTSYPASPQNYLANYGASIPQQVVPQSFISHPQPQPTVQQYGGYNSPIHVSAPGGQFYLCNPIPTPTNNIAGVSGVEIREATNLQTLMEEYDMKNKSSSITRAREFNLVCPLGEQACLDNTKCIKNYKVCDGEVHCDDASDEIVCNCKQRIGKIRLCDGYCDCPTCDDELGCFGCTNEEFSCDDWSRYRRSTCIPKHQRCDNIKQCEITGKDEQGCSILTDHIGNFSLNTVSNSVGFLHRNYKGKWYPTCLGTEEWADEVCQTESGPSLVSPKSRMILTTDQYQGEFINILPNDEVSLVPTCIQDRAAFVECPPLYCGLRYLFKNAYRGEEVDTSIEDTLNDLERYTLGNELKDKSNSNDTAANIQEYDFYDTENVDLPTLEESRIVGGKPSQPAAWPWLVSIYKNGIFHCGGVLINELWIVTAAHCVDRFWLYYYEIQAGALRRFSFSPMDQTRVAKLVISHEFYSKSNLRNDIALMKVSTPFRYNRYVRPICLPSESTAGTDFLKGPLPGTKCTTVGWGATLEHGADPDHVREVDIPILSHCKQKDDNDAEEICAGLHEGGKDACQGDSGGPLICRNPNNPNQWYLAGIVSHGEGCARPNEPGVYTRVSKYMGWIAENTRDGVATLRTSLQKCPGFICKGTKRCVSKKRHCDKIVDCLLGDDEINCDNTFHDLFKHSRNSLIDRKRVEFENEIINNMAEDLAPELSVIGSKNLLEEFNQPMANLSKELENNKSKVNAIKEKFYFKCTRLLQVIPGNKRCNKIIDCEDGTDEINCTCRDYVYNEDENAICDGIADCVDFSDEIFCANCTESEFACHSSQECIPFAKRCDGIKDCKSHEDETNCAILSNAKFLTIEKDNQPSLLSKGVITINRNGIWKPLCLKNNSDNTEASAATKICNELGFGEYSSYHKYVVEDKEIVVMKNNDIKLFAEVNKTIREPCNNCCKGLFVSCFENSFTPTNLKHKKLANLTELYSLPWTAAIFTDGTYKCMGTLIDTKWIVASAECFSITGRLDRHHVTAALGKGKLQLSVKGPYEQIVKIVKNISIASGNIILLQTEKNLTFDRYVQPAKIDVRRDSLQKEKCYAAGLDHNNRILFVNVIPVKNCLVGYRCFEAKQQEQCKYDQLWSGTIVCDSRNGWYPAAVFGSIKGPCGLSPNMRFSSIKYYKNQIASLINQTQHKESTFPLCDGFLCELGKCIPKSKICDGISDCQGYEDENPDLCYEKEKKCHLQDECICPQSHLKCPSSNKCFPKSSYCDRVNNCGEFEDEPVICSCRNYLNLTSPERICDGVLHCMDRSDEDPKICSCKINDFQCGNNSTHCVPQDLVCDGVDDCPNGEDEKTCLSLNVEKHEKSNAGEVLSRTAGVWHTGCFSLNYTTIHLEDMCMKLGFTGGSASQLPSPKNLTSMEALKPVLDQFEAVWLRRIPGNRMKLRIRTGNDPYVKFVPDKGCHRLFIACI